MSVLKNESHLQSSNKPISIIIPAYNQLDYCRKCITSIQANTQRAYKLILVDNGSTDGVGAFFDAIPHAEVVHTGTNLGFAAGVNRGLEHAEGHVLLLNSDTLVPNGWLTRLEQALLSADDIGMVGPMTNSAPGAQRIDGLELDSLAAINTYAAELARRNAGKILEAYRLVGFCMLIRESAWHSVGTLDEAFGIGTYEDGDYCLRVIQSGHRICIAEDCFVFHYGGRTFEGMGMTTEDLNALTTKNERMLFDKWGRFAAAHSEAALKSKQINAQAQAACSRGDFTEAVALLSEAIRAYPMNEKNYNDLGVIVWEMGDRAGAFENFVRAIRRNPDYEDGKVNLLRAAEVLNKETEAKQIMEEAQENAIPFMIRRTREERSDSSG